jgi:hypothetical protein
MILKRLHCNSNFHSSTLSGVKKDMLYISDVIGILA